MISRGYMKKPLHRSKLRLKIGVIYYGLLRKLLWIKMSRQFAYVIDLHKMPFVCFSHKTPLLRKLKDVDMWYQYNKIINLKIALQKINGIIIRPGETFSFWKSVGKPTKRKGYVDGMVLNSGTFTAGIGGGLCQLTNLIFWAALHTPLTVIERHRHGYDVFPDSNRTQPFGSGATCFYPHRDLMLRNDTNHEFQLILNLDDEFLEGEWRSNKAPEYKYSVLEKNHYMKSEYWGGYSRHNELYRQIFDLNNTLIEEYLVVENSGIMMYEPFLEGLVGSSTN